MILECFDFSIHQHSFPIYCIESVRTSQPMTAGFREKRKDGSPAGAAANSQNSKNQQTPRSFPMILCSPAGSLVKRICSSSNLLLFSTPYFTPSAQLGFCCRVDYCECQLLLCILLCEQGLNMKPYTSL